MEAAGFTDPDSYDQVVYRGDLAGREFIAFCLSGGAVMGGMNVNVWDVNDDIQALIRSRRRVDEARLADLDIMIADL
jgi:3-phenylpropionate/trans-cinnamate dioxygenase ferredoxin reductase subunit